MSERELPAASGASMLASRCPVRRCLCLHGRATSCGRGWPYSLDIAVVDAIAARRVAEDRLRERPSLYGPVRISGESLVATTIAQRAHSVRQPWRSRCPAAISRSECPSRWWARPVRRSGQCNTMAGSLGDTRAELADIGHGSSRRPTRPGASSGTIPSHRRSGQGTTVQAELSIVSLGSRPTASSGRVVRS